MDPPGRPWLQATSARVLIAMWTGSLALYTWNVSGSTIMRQF
jgi:hypothetical protein